MTSETVKVGGERDLTAIRSLAEHLWESPVAIRRNDRTDLILDEAHGSLAHAREQVIAALEAQGLAVSIQENTEHVRLRVSEGSRCTE